MKVEKVSDISKVAAKHASSALSRMINHPVSVDMFPVIELNENEMPHYMRHDAESVFISIKLSGDLRGYAVIVFPVNDALQICDMLLKRQGRETKDFLELEISAITEIGNVLIGNFLGPFAYPLKLESLLHHVPVFQRNHFEDFFEKLDQNLTNIGQKIMMEIVINFQNTKVNGNLILLLGMKEMEKILENV